MSSLRNSLHRRSHKERCQLAHPAKFWILEKHRDYVLRVRDYHSKQERIQTLRRKAANRNKDEFYFGMVNQRTNVRVSMFHAAVPVCRTGLILLCRKVHIRDRGNVATPVNTVKVPKTQDGNYVRTMSSSNTKVNTFAFDIRSGT